MDYSATQRCGRTARWGRFGSLVCAALALTALVLASGCIPAVDDFDTHFGNPSPYYFAYAAHGDGTVSMSRVQISDGKVTQTGYVMASPGVQAVSVLAHPSGKYLYAMTGSGIFLYGINPVSGVLSQLAGPYAPGPDYRIGTIAGSGAYLYATDQAASGLVYGFTIDPSTGFLTPVPGGSFAAGNQPIGIATDSTGRFLYTAYTGGAPGGLISFQINSDGSLTTLQPFVAAGANPNHPALHPNGKYLYSVDVTGDAVYGYTIAANGTLTLIPGSPLSLPSCLTAVAITFDATGSFGYVGCETATRVEMIGVNPATGALVDNGFISTPAGSNPAYVTVSPDNRIAYVGDLLIGQMLSATIDQNTGNLTPLDQWSVRPQPGFWLLGLVQPAAPVTLVSKFAYTGNNNSNDVTAFSVDGSTGNLTQMGATISTGGTNPQYLAADPFGRFIYVPNQITADVAGYTIDPATGKLTSVVGGNLLAAAGADLIGSAVDPSGRFLYITGQTSGNVYPFSINQGTGALILGAAVGAGTQPSSIAIDPSGQFAYAANLGSSDITAYTIAPLTGALGSPATTPTGTNPRDIAVHPNGRWLYTANDYELTGPGGDVTVFSIATNGTITPRNGTVPLSTYAAGGSTNHIAIHPSGKYLYATNQVTNDVSVFAIDQNLGTLTLIGSNVPADVFPLWATIDITGQHLYISNQTNSLESIYAIDPATGMITSIGPPVSAGGSSPQSIYVLGSLQ